MNSFKAKSIFIFVAIACLYFSGVAAIIYPMISNVLSLSTSRTVIENYDQTVEKMDNTDIKTKLENADKFNADIAKGIYHDGLERSLCDENGLMCYVEVPVISVYLPVYYGATDENLARGCAYLENTSLPVGGESTHSVISGHTGLPSADMFTKLDQVETGNVFFIHVLDQVLAYQVVSIDAVTPSKTELLTVVDGKDYVTLLTCTPYGINDKRLLVRGERIPYNADTTVFPTSAGVPLDDDSDEALSVEIRHQITIIVAIVLAAIIIFIFALIWFFASMKPRSDSEGQNVTQKTD